MRGVGARALVLGVAIPMLAAACQERVSDEADPGVVRVVVDSLEDVMERGIEANDPDAVVALFAEDAVELPPNQPRRVGIPDITERYATYLSSVPDAVVSLTPDRVEVSSSGDLAWEVGSAYETGTGPDGTPHAVTAKYLVVWERQDGEWKIAARMFSADERFDDEGEG